MSEPLPLEREKRTQNPEDKKRWPDWIETPLRSLRPPERITVSEWADRNRYLDAKSSNEPGRWRTARTPYLGEIMDSFTDPEVEEIVFVKPTQVGGTECLLNIIGYIIDQDASPTLAIYPTDTLGESISKNRLQPMIRLSPALQGRFRDRDSKLTELQFDGMTVNLTGANSPAQLASRPIRFLLMDEVDKYPPRTGKEGNPVALARERTKTFAYNKKIYITSTPTYKEGPIWEEFESCETQYHFYVPCPHCGEYQRLRFRQVKWDHGEKAVAKRAATAHYECAYCEGIIHDADKADMLARGRWKSEKTGSRKKVGFHLNAIYSPWVTFEDVAHEWLKTERDPDSRMNFINSWLAEPWEPVGTTADTEKVLSKQSRYTRGMVPDETMLITGGVDKQKTCFYYTVRGWGANRKSWNIDHGSAKTYKEVLEIFDQGYHDEAGGLHYVDLALMDSGDDTDEVYDFCYVNQGLFAPVKGSSTMLPSRFRLSVIDKANSAANGMRLIICDGSYYKDMIFRRLNRPEDNSWSVYDGCDQEYAEQIVSEHKVLDRVGGRPVWVWRPKMSGIDNHYLDCEVYAACAADVMGGFELLEADREGEEPPKQLPPAQDTSESGWLPGGGWLPEGNWL